jgi:predicted Zn-dependent protease
MADSTHRMKQLEALLADDPNDSFLRYGLAMEHASAGDDATAVHQLMELIAIEPYVPAYHMAGQIYNRLGRVEEAMVILRAGIDQARKQGDSHARGEMEGLLMSIE